MDFLNLVSLESNLCLMKNEPEGDEGVAVLFIMNSTHTSFAPGFLCIVRSCCADPLDARLAVTIPLPAVPLPV